MEVFHVILPLVATALGGALTLLGGFWAHRREQAEREKERRHALKREVLLDLMDALTAARQFLTDFGRVDMTVDQQMVSLSAIGGRIERVHLVGDAQTVRALSEISDLFAEASAELAKLRYAYQGADSDLGLKQLERSQISQRQSFLTTTLNALPRPSQLPPNNPEVRHLLRSLQDSQARSEALDAEILAMTEAKNSAQLALVRAAVRHAVELDHKAIQLKIAIRHELGITEGLADLDRILRDSLSKRREVLTEALDLGEELARGQSTAGRE